MRGCNWDLLPFSCLEFGCVSLHLFLTTWINVCEVFHIFNEHEHELLLPETEAHL